MPPVTRSDRNDERPTASLEPLFGLLGEDLSRVNALIVERMASPVMWQPGTRAARQRLAAPLPQPMSSTC